MNKKFFLISLATILTTGTVAFAQEAPVPSASPAAPEVNAEEEAQKTLLYKVACNSDAELVMDQELVNQVGSNEQLTTLRNDFQSFAKDPTAFLATQISQYDDMKTQALQMVTQQVPATELQAKIEEYAKANNVSVDEATTAVVDQRADLLITQFTGQKLTRDSVIVNSSMHSCGFIKFLEPKIAATGCKTAEGQVLDLSAANGVCKAIEVPAQTLAQIDGQISSIQQETDMVLQIIKHIVLKGVDADVAPLVESKKGPESEIVKTITDMISASQGATAPAPVAAPAVP